MRARGRLSRPLALLAFWTIPGLISTSQIYLLWTTMPDRISFSTAAVWQMLPWLFWALPTPLIVHLARRFRFERRTWPLALAIHLATNTVIALVHFAIAVQTGRLAGIAGYLDYPFSEVYWKLVTRNVHLDLLTYWGVVAVALALEYRQAWRERTLAAAQLEARLTQARLEALKSQLHPHFLFNTLNAVATLVRKQDSAAAVRMLSGLSDLLRLTLDSNGRQIVPLKDELDFVDRYLEIQRIRFGERLSVERRVAASALDAAIPPLILQPLVENAIRHGVAPRASGGHIELSAKRQGDRLVVSVRDDGYGLRPGWTPGVGIANTRARLEQLHPGAHEFVVEDDPRGGAIARLEVPYLHAA